MKETIFVHLSCVVTSLSIRIWWCSRLMVMRRAWKRSATVVAAALEEGGSLGRRVVNQHKKCARQTKDTKVH
jgi:uncharacterized protein (DUF111 family)